MSLLGQEVSFDTRCLPSKNRKWMLNYISNGLHDIARSTVFSNCSCFVFGKCLKLRTLKGVFLRILNDGFGSWKWWDNVESTDKIWCILTLYENNYFGSWNTWEHFELNLGWYMMHSGAIWNHVLKVETAENILKQRKLNVQFWRHLKRCFGSCNC